MLSYEGVGSESSLKPLIGGEACSTRDSARRGSPDPAVTTPTGGHSIACKRPWIVPSDATRSRPLRVHRRPPVSGVVDGMSTPELRRHPGSPNAYSSARGTDWEMILPMITPETGGSCLGTFAFFSELQFHWMDIP